MSVRIHTTDARKLAVLHAAETSAIVDFFDDEEMSDVPGPALILNDGWNGEAMVIIGDRAALLAFADSVRSAAERAAPPTLEWKVASWSGFDDVEAPHGGNYWRATVGEWLARIWTDVNGYTFVDVSSRDAVLHHGTPELNEFAPTVDAAKERATEYVNAVLSRDA
jgi:hypothetical protein